MPRRCSAVTIACGLFIFGGGVIAEDAVQETPPAGRKGELVHTVTAFLDAWLVRKDVDAAMRYVSAAPILGKCSLPPALARRSSLSGRDFRRGIRSILSLVAAKTPSEKILGTVVKPYGAVPPGEPSVNEGQPYDLFSLREFKDAALVCKFDQSASFRRTFERPGVWYSTFEIKSPQHDFGLERSRRANWKTGYFSRAEKDRRRAEARQTRELVRELRAMLSELRTPEEPCD